MVRGKHKIISFMLAAFTVFTVNFCLPMCSEASEVSSSVQVTFSVVEPLVVGSADDQNIGVSPTPEAIQIYRDAIRIEGNASRGRMGEQEALSAIKGLIAETNRVLDPVCGLHPAMCNVVKIQVSYTLASVINSVATVQIRPGNEGLLVTELKIRESAAKVAGLIEYLEEQLSGTYLDELLGGLPRAVIVDTLGEDGDYPARYEVENAALELLRDSGIGLDVRADRILFKCSPTVLLSTLPDGGLPIEEETNEGKTDENDPVESSGEAKPPISSVVFSVWEARPNEFDERVKGQVGLMRVSPVLDVGLSIPPGSYVKMDFILQAQEVQQFDLRKLGVYNLENHDDSLNYFRSKYDGKIRAVEFTTGQSGQYAVLAQNKTFSDLAGHWAQEEVELLAAQNILDGVGGGLFLPDGHLNRAQFVTMLVRALGLSTIGEDTVTFKDVALDDWFAEYLTPALSVGLVSGYPDNTFRPEKIMTRQEMAVLVSRALGLAGKGKNIDSETAKEILVRFHDFSNISPWAIEELALVVNANLMNGLPSGDIEPGRYATRSEGASLLHKLLVYTDLMPPYPFDLY